MLAFVHSLVNPNVKIAVFAAKKGFEVQLIDGLECFFHATVFNSETVSELAAKYGIELWGITLRSNLYNDKVYLADK